VDQLRVLLYEHLYVESSDVAAVIRRGEHALRVRTDDDEVDLACYFVDDQAAAMSPDRLAYLLHDTWPLPVDTSAADAEFSHGVPVRTVRLAPPSAESVFSVRHLASLAVVAWPRPATHPSSGFATRTEQPKSTQRRGRRV
jgi:hypothetical protein